MRLRSRFASTAVLVGDSVAPVAPVAKDHPVVGLIAVAQVLTALFACRSWNLSFVNGQELTATRL